MAYLIFSVNQREIGRRKLDSKLVVGRSADCNVCVHDILLSRSHCQFEPEGAGWAVVDLASKNGTVIEGQQIQRKILRDGDKVLIGKTTITFTVLKPAPAKVNGGAALAIPNSPRPRPADPWEALQATVSGYDYLKAKAEEDAVRIGSKPRMEMAPTFKGVRLPTPQPSPREPVSYESEDIYSMLNELVSSSWDSIYMTASRPARPIPRPPIIAGARHPRDRDSSAHLALQVTQGLLATATPRKNKTPGRWALGFRWKRAFTGVARGLATMGRAAVLLGTVHLFGHV